MQVLYNTKGYHSMATYLNVLNNAVLRANLPPSRGNPAAYGTAKAGPAAPGAALTHVCVCVCVCVCVAGITLINHPMNRTSTSLSLDYL